MGEGNEDATPLGIRGQHVIMGEYSLAADNPQRLSVVFKSEWWCLDAAAGFMRQQPNTVSLYFRVACT